MGGIRQGLDVRGKGPWFGFGLLKMGNEYVSGVRVDEDIGAVDLDRLCMSAR